MKTNFRLAGCFCGCKIFWKLREREYKSMNNHVKLQKINTYDAIWYFRKKKIEEFLEQTNLKMSQKVDRFRNWQSIHSRRHASRQNMHWSNLVLKLKKNDEVLGTARIGQQMIATSFLLNPPNFYKRPVGLRAKLENPDVYRPAYNIIFEENGYVEVMCFVNA